MRTPKFGVSFRGEARSLALLMTNRMSGDCTRQVKTDAASTSCPLPIRDWPYAGESVPNGGLPTIGVEWHFRAIADQAGV